MGKKKLDNLFQERLRDYGEVPDEKVWHAIEASLDKKKRSRVLPLWWKLGSVAAILAIALLAINTFSDTLGNDNTVSDREQKDAKKQEMNSNEPELQEPMETSIVTTDNKGESNSSQSDGEPSGIPRTPSSVIQNDPVNKAHGADDLKTNRNTVSSPLIDKRSQVTSAQQQDVARAVSENELQEKSDVAIAPQQEVLDVVKSQDVADQRKTDRDLMDPSEQDTLTHNDPLKKGVENTDGLKKEEKIKHILTEPNHADKDGVVKIDELLEDTITVQDGKKSIFDEIKAQEESPLAEVSKTKWSAGANIAPVYFDAFGKGSPVHSIFVPNAKSGETNISYGLSIAYEISDKLSVRSGLQKVDYGYNTNDIEFTSSLEGASQIANIDYALTSRTLVLQSKAGQAGSFLGNEPALMASDASAKNPARDGSMSQQFGYLEVPLELNYALVDRKFGPHLIGGVSSLFLVDNAVSLSTGNQKLQMGEANNVNSVNFSTNVGFGVDYNFSPKIKLNVEPIFKYQLNTFSGVDGTFKPYSVGVYSGLSFKF